VKLVDATAYTYTVQAINTAGNGAATGSATTPGIAIAAPTAFTAIPNVAGSLIALQWTDNATNETSYRVDESTDGGKTWVVLPPVLARTTAQTTGVGGLVRHQRTPAVPGTVYTFRVTAQNVAQKSDSDYATATASLLGPVAPATPVGLAATVNNAGAVTLTWTADTAVAGTTLSYLVSINGAAPIVVNGTTFRPTAAQMPVGKLYSVTVAAQATQYGLSIPSAPSAPVLVNLSAPAVPAVPTGLAAAINNTSGAVTLTWTAVTGASGYQVSINGGAPIAVAGTTFRPTAVQMPVNAVYSVTVAAQTTLYGQVSTSAASAPVSANLTVTTPATPVQAAPTVTATRATLSWGAVTGATAYVVQSSTNGGAWTTVTTINNGATVTYNAALVAGNSYSFQVLAQTTKYGLPTLTSAASNAVTANTAAAGSTAVTAIAGAVGSKAITVSWTNTSSNLLAGSAAFTVQRRAGAGAWATITPTVTATSATTYSFTDATGVTGTTYSYHVMASGTGGNSAYSAATAGVRAP
jgi:hypothetical protein